MDAIAAAVQKEREDRLPFIAVDEFWVDYEPQPDGSQKAVEWVRWVKKGMTNPYSKNEKIARYLKNPQHPEWTVIEPHYKAWKAGQSAPIAGTPLAAWPGATPWLVKALTPCNIRSIEDLAEMEDSAIQRLAIPGLREKQRQARTYLEAQKTTAKVSGEIGKLRDENEALRRDLLEMRELIERYAVRKDEPQAAPLPLKRGPGRPRKNPEIAPAQ